MTKPYQVKDPYFLRAKQRGYRARSAFKLLDIERKFHLFHKGQKVVDLGAAPGSFMQVILEKIGPEGQLVGVDLQRIESLDRKNARMLQADIYNEKPLLEALASVDMGQVDVVTSDLAPKTSGIRDVDQGLSVALTEQAFHLATQLLVPGGHFVGKVFEGEDLPHLIKQIKAAFKQVKIFKPPSCRDRSFETYIVAMGYRLLQSQHENKKGT